MTVNLVGGVDYSQWRKLSTGETSTVATNSVETNNTTYVNNQSDAYVSSSSETCTDGRDDGKIGFWSALGNAAKGVAKTVVNGVKGMFTNKEGKFSLGKTLLSIGTAALCVAVPAVGVAACVVGGTMGAIQVGKGIYNAATAETDAEAKEAWQNIGGGAFSVAASVVGAKAGIKAVKATSSAGGAKGISALDQLDDAASIGQKAVALGKDMVSSTKNQCNSIASSITGKVRDYTETAKGYNKKQQMNKAEAKLNKANERLDSARSSGNDAKIEKLQSAADEAQTNFDKMQAEYDKLADGTKQKVEDLATKKQKTNNPFTKAKKSGKNASGEVTEANATPISEEITPATETVATPSKKISLNDIQTRIAKELSSGKKSFEEAVSDYGYDNVAQVLEYLGGTLFASENQ